MQNDMKSFLDKKKKSLKEDIVEKVENEAVKITPTVEEKIEKVEPTVEKIETTIIEEKIVLDENETKALDFYANSADISIPVLVSMVLKDKCGKAIKENHSFDLKLRGYIDNESNITKEGKLYLESDRTKNRIQKILNY